MKAVALIANLTKPQVREIAAVICAWFSDRGIETYAQEELGCGRGFSLAAPLPPVDLVMVLGGDGTFLTAAGRYGASGIPLLGVNLGHLGFLAEVELEDLQSALVKLVAGDYQVEKRSMLSLVVLRQGKILAQDLVLNDVVVAKGTLSRIIQLEVAVDGVNIGSYRGDGLIIATPTGSTGYSLSAGGPIVAPNLDLLVITPICPHTLNARPMVVAKESLVTVAIKTCQADTYLTMDGQKSIILECGDRLQIANSEHRTALVRLAGLNFYEILAKKIMGSAR